jgi:hypothetical protein
MKWTPGSAFRTSSIFRMTAFVRCIDAASGSCTFIKKNAWSSCGMNDVGMIFPRPPASAVKAASTTTVTATFRIRKPQART